ncbi:putative transporter [Colletotrichum sp. SAR 10_70]|nr:putative transporter [Colletotrichum sp. SAR 10_70]
MSSKAPETSGSETDVNVRDELPPSTGEVLGSVEPHVFSNPRRATHWQQVYESATYEGRHRFNAALTCDYNTGQTIYLVCFLAAELPGGLISKKVGPFRYTPTIITMFGLLCALQTPMNNRASFWAFRGLLGFVQGGFIPEMVLYLSYFYKNNELPIRLSVFYTVIPITQIYGALLAAGFLAMRGIREHEEEVLVNRILRDDPTKGDMNNRTAVTFHGLRKALMTVDLWPIFLVGLFAWIPFQPTANYLSLILRDMGYSVFESNMLAIPSYALFAINASIVLIFGWLSEYFKERSIVSSCSNIWMLPFFIALVALPESANPWVRYALLTGINSIPYTHSVLVGMASRNSRSVGSIAAVNIYRDEDKPYYYTANKTLIGLCVFNIVLFIGMKLYYIWRNRILERRYAEASEAEKQTAIDMRFAH